MNKFKVGINLGEQGFFDEGKSNSLTGTIPHGLVLCDRNNGMPDLRGRFLEGTGSYSGEFKDAGLN